MTKPNRNDLFTENPLTDSATQRYTGRINQSKYAHMRWIYLILGFVFFALGIIGAVLPVMPTAPFILLAAACWARGSQRFYSWLINHQYMGKYVRDWEDYRAIPRRGKWLACIMMGISGTMLILTVPNTYVWGAWVVVMMCFCVAIYLWRLPDA